MEEKQELVGKDKEQVLLMVHGEILLKLLQYDRFQMFIASNYEIKPHVDHEGKSVGFDVREFSQQEVAELMSKVLKEAQNKIVTVSPGELEKLDKSMLNKKK